MDNDYYIELTLVIDVTEVFVDGKIKFISKPKKVAVLHSQQFHDESKLSKIKAKMLEDLPYGFSVKTPHHFTQPVKRAKKYAPITYRI